MNKNRVFSMISASIISLLLVSCAQQSTITPTQAIEAESITPPIVTTAAPTQTPEPTQTQTPEPTPEEIGVDIEGIIAWVVPKNTDYLSEETGAGPAISFVISEPFDTVYATYINKIAENRYAFATGKEAEVVEEKVGDSKSKLKATAFWIVKQEAGSGTEERIYVQLTENEDKSAVNCIFTVFAVNSDMFEQINDVEESLKITLESTAEEISTT